MKDSVNVYLQTTDKILGKIYYKFLGIPFAEPPVGHLRYKPPRPPKSWVGVRNAFECGSECVQVGSSVTGEEDCLYLNIYTPQLPKDGYPLKPVMFWIYGGSFQTGHGGFLSLENDKVSGNYGLKDQVQAMKWVQENIANFGGNPKKVTIFGESAGAASVHYQLLTPLTKGLFHQAIIQSGSALSFWAFSKMPKANAIKLAEFMGKNLTDENELLSFFMNQSAFSLAKACNDLEQKELKNFRANYTFFAPSVETLNSEETFITHSPMEIMLSGNFNKVPLMIGTLNAEGTLVLAVVKLTDEYLTMLNENSEWAVPTNWDIPAQAERNQIGHEVKKYLLKGKKISWKSLNDMLKFFTDSLIVMDVDKSISAFLNYSDYPIYNYEMVYESKNRRLSKLMAQLKQGRIVSVKGAGHTDELPLIFRINVLDILPFSMADQIVSQKMTNMWSSFAKTGNPNYPGLEVEWKKLEKNRSYLEIGSKLVVKTGRVNEDRLKFWEDLCKTTSTDYICVSEF